MKRHLLSAAALILVASATHAESAKTTTKAKAAAVLSPGIALEYVEPGVRAQDRWGCCARPATKFRT